MYNLWRVYVEFLTWGWRSYRRNLRWVVDFFKSRYLVGQARKHCCMFCIISYAVPSKCIVVHYSTVRGRKARPSRRRSSWFAGESHATSISLRVHRVYVATFDGTHTRTYSILTTMYMRNIHPLNASEKKRYLRNYFH